MRPFSSVCTIALIDVTLSRFIMSLSHLSVDKKLIIAVYTIDSHTYVCLYFEVLFIQRVKFSRSLSLSKREEKVMREMFVVFFEIFLFSLSL